jgi:hypothetical protein
MPCLGREVARVDQHFTPFRNALPAFGVVQNDDDVIAVLALLGSSARRLDAFPVEPMPQVGCLFWFVLTLPRQEPTHCDRCMSAVEVEALLTQSREARGFGATIGPICRRARARPASRSLVARSQQYLFTVDQDDIAGRRRCLARWAFRSCPPPAPVLRDVATRISAACDQKQRARRVAGLSASMRNWSYD